MRKRVQGGREVPLIHRSMSVEVAKTLIHELNTAFRYLDLEQYPELDALRNDLRGILRQLEAGDVKRPC